CAEGGGGRYKDKRDRHRHRSAGFDRGRRALVGRRGTGSIGTAQRQRRTRGVRTEAPNAAVGELSDRASSFGSLAILALRTAAAAHSMYLSPATVSAFPSTGALS